jgi:Protein of unknown function (DUF3237)
MAIADTQSSVRVDAREPRLEHLYDMHVDLEAPQSIAGAPAGTRQIFIVKAGRVEGPKINGDVLPGGGDWALVRTDGVIQLDVRATIKTDDGAMIYGTYSGLLVLTPDVGARIFGGQDVPLGDYYFYGNPMFQTGDERYAWLNKVIALSRGRAIAGAVEYRTWAVENPG